MNARRTYYAMLALLAMLTVALIGGAYGVQTLLQNQSNQLVGNKAKLATLQQQQSGLVRDKKDIKTYTGIYNIAKTIVPENKDQVQAVRQIVNLAAASKVTLANISFPQSTLGNSPPGTPANATPAPISSASTALSQLTPVPHIPGVYNLQLTVDSDPNQLATYPELINFLSALEQNRLTALVSSIIIVPSATQNGFFSFNLTLDIYIKP